MAYHYDSRRLNFLRSPDLVVLVERLGDFDTAAEALATVPPKRQAAFTKALESLAASNFLESSDPDHPDSEALAPSMRAESRTTDANRCGGTEQLANVHPNSEALEATGDGAPAPSMRAESRTL